LEKEEVGKLRRAIQRSRFFELKKKYSHAGDDQVSLVLNIALGEKTHCVGVYAPDKLRSNQDGREFIKIWDEILKVVPDPNRGMTKALEDR
jgi:hypothetical protein